MTSQSQTEIERTMTATWQGRSSIIGWNSIKFMILFVADSWSVSSTTAADTSQYSAMTPRIVGGMPAKTGGYPAYGFNAGADDLCGGTLIHPDVVLTAAHCSSIFLDGWYQGGNQISGSGSEFVGVKLEFPHSNYNKAGMQENDIMLLKLAKPLTTTLQKLNFDPTFPPAVSKTAEKLLRRELFLIHSFFLRRFCTGHCSYCNWIWINLYRWSWLEFYTT